MQNDDLFDELTKDAAKESTLTFKDLKSKDGIMTRATGHGQSLLHRVISVGNIREELKTGLFKNIQEPDKAVAAWYQLYRLGLDTTPVELTIIARNAGINHELLRDTLHTISQTTFTTNYIKDRDGGRRRKGSALET